MSSFVLLVGVLFVGLVGCDWWFVELFSVVRLLALVWDFCFCFGGCWVWWDVGFVWCCFLCGLVV